MLSASLFGVAHASSGVAGFEVTYETEQPGAQNATLGSSSTFSIFGVETFNEQPTGYNNTGFTTNFNLPSNALYNITGHYSPLSTNGLQINKADEYGGAGGNSNYIVTFNDPGYELTLTTTDPAGIDYFGFWLSALDNGNYVTFYNGNNYLFTFDPQDVLNAVGTNNAYSGNPNTPFLGQNYAQPYVFLNFYATGGVTFTNHTVGDWLTMSGTQVPLNGSSFTSGPIPEPADWALIFIGTGVLGAVVRRSRKVTLARG